MLYKLSCRHAARNAPSIGWALLVSSKITTAQSTFAPTQNHYVPKVDKILHFFSVFFLRHIPSIKLILIHKVCSLCNIYSIINSRSLCNHGNFEGIFCPNKMSCAFNALVTALKLFTNRDGDGNRKSFKISSVISMAYLVQSLINPFADGT